MSTMEWIAAFAGGLWGLHALEKVRQERQPCGFCRQMEDRGLAPWIAAGVGAAAGMSALRIGMAIVQKSVIPRRTPS